MGIAKNEDLEFQLVVLDFQDKIISIAKVYGIFLTPFDNSRNKITIEIEVSSFENLWLAVSFLGFYNRRLFSDRVLDDEFTKILAWFYIEITKYLKSNWQFYIE